MVTFNYNDLKTRTKLLLAFSFIILLILPLIMLNTYSMMQMNTHVNEIVNGSFPKLQVLLNTQKNVNTLNETASNLNLAGNSSVITRGLEQSSRNKILNAIDALKKEKTAYAELISKYPKHDLTDMNQFTMLGNQLIDSSLEFIQVADKQQIGLLGEKNAVLQKNIASFNQFLSSAISDNQGVLHLLQYKTQTTLEQNSTINLILSTLIVIISILICIRLANKISKPLVQLTRSALKVASPDFNLEDFNFKEFGQTKYGYRKDEVGLLSSSLQKMTQAIFDKHQVLQRLIEEFSISEIYKNAIFNSTMDGIISVNSEGIIKEHNSAASIILRCGKEKSLIGKKISNFIHLNWANTKKHPPKASSEYVMTCVDDKQIPIELTVVKIKDIEPESHTLFIRDLSHQKEVEYDVELRNRITKILALSSGEEEALQKTLEILINYYPLYVAEFWKVNTSKNSLQRHTISFCPNLELLETEFQDYRNKFIDESISELGLLKSEVLASREITYYDETNPEIFYSESLNKIIPAKSVVGVPLLFENEILGIVQLFFQEPFRINKQFFEFINPIANQIGSFLARIKNQDEIILLNQKLVQSARQGGMVEVATNILHNVGNVLNSINISIFTLNDQLQKNHLANLRQVTELMRANSHRLTEFINQDAKGSLLLDYIDKLATKLVDERTYFKNEISMLIKNVEHIKNIISLQQKITGSSGFTETVLMADVIDDSIKISFTEGHYISLQKEYRVNKPVVLDKIKTQQIIVNLIRNAVESLMESKQRDKKIIVALSVINKGAKQFIEIKIKDNGNGILADNLIRIFNFGFTTKKSGHGFGLHASIIAAEELGGSLVATSDGLNKGATFVLCLPYEPYAPKVLTEKTLLSD